MGCPIAIARFSAWLSVVFFVGMNHEGLSRQRMTIASTVAEALNAIRCEANDIAVMAMRRERLRQPGCLDEFQPIRNGRGVKNLCPAHRGHGAQTFKTERAIDVIMS